MYVGVLIFDGCVSAVCVMVFTIQKWDHRRLVLLKRSSRGPLRLVVISDKGNIEQRIYLSDYTFIARVDPSIRPHALAISFRSRPCFRFSAESGQYRPIMHDHDLSFSCAVNSTHPIGVCKSLTSTLNSVIYSSSYIRNALNKISKLCRLLSLLS